MIDILRTDQTETGKCVANDSADPLSLVFHTFGFMATQTLRAAVELGIFDAFDEDSMAVAPLADRLTLPTGATARLLRALAALNLLVEEPAGVFRPTATGRLLRADHPESMRSFVSMFGDPVMQRAWEHLPASVRSGTPAFDEVFGMPFFSYLRGDPDKAELFNRTMSVVSDMVGSELAESFGFGDFQTLVDVGGGDGTTLAAILAVHPHLLGVVYDSAAGAAQADDMLDRRGVGGRTRVVNGDFFVNVPVDADLYLLKNVLHDWDDEPATAILRNCRAVIRSTGRLLIVEPTLPEIVGPDTPPAAYLDDLNMMVNLGGRTRTPDEFDELCSAAGFEVTGAKPFVQGAAWLFEGRPI
jgi:SAM-dependent methyltransferase